MFKKLLSAVMAFLIMVSIGAMFSSFSVGAEKFKSKSTECGENVCLVCDINGRCHLERKDKIKEVGAFFDLPSLDKKVAPRDPKVRCDKFPKPGCPNYIPPDDQLQKSKDGTIIAP